MSVEIRQERNSDMPKETEKPAGGPGGFEFDVEAPDGLEIGLLEVKYSPTNSSAKHKVVAGIAVWWRNPADNALQGPVTIGNMNGGTETGHVTLGAGEFIVEVGGRATQFGDQIRFESNIPGNTWGPFGGRGGDPFEFPDLRVPRKEIYGFFGRAAALVDAIGVYTRPR
jgi:hypothetical protein